MQRECSAAGCRCRAGFLQWAGIPKAGKCGSFPHQTLQAACLLNAWEMRVQLHHLHPHLKKSLRAQPCAAPIRLALAVQPVLLQFPGSSIALSVLGSS
eukprot:2900587-Rhodomonas_salina.1